MPATAKYRSERSEGGHALPVLKSALQKYIRRGEAVLALQTAREFHTFANVPPEEAGQAKRIRTNYVHRLMVIVLEDVGDLALISGLADSLAVIARLPFGDAEAKMHETFVIRQACAWAKSRAGSHAKAVATLPLAPGGEQNAAVARYPEVRAAMREFSKPESIAAPITTWTATFAQLIAQAQRSQSPVAKIEALFWGWRIANSDQAFTPTVLFPRRKRGIWIALSVALTACARKGERWDVMGSYLEHLIGIQECHLCWLLPTLSAVGLSPPYPSPLPLPPITPALLQAVQTQAYEIKPYVLDKHVGGSHQCRGLRPEGETDGQRFVNEGSVVYPEAPPAFAMFRQIYIDRKINPAGGVIVPRVPELESSKYRLVLRTQLVTGDGKTDSYFAYPTSGCSPEPSGLVVVKGPFPMDDHNYQALVGVLMINRLKGGLGLMPNQDLRVEIMVPNMTAPEYDTSLGLRRHWRGRPGASAYFLVSSSWVDEKDLDARFHSSKVWPPTIVADWSRRLAKHVFSPDRLREWLPHGPLLLEQYVLHLCLRYVMGVGDHADRNFLVVNDTTLVSVDEEPSVRPPETMRSVIREKRTELIRTWMASNLPKLQIHLGNIAALVATVRADMPQLLDAALARTAALAHNPLAVV